jgi:hypothetical protein
MRSGVHAPPSSDKPQLQQGFSCHDAGPEQTRYIDQDRLGRNAPLSCFSQHTHTSTVAPYLALIAGATARPRVDAAAGSPAPAETGATAGTTPAASVGDEGAGPPRAAHAAALNGPSAGGFTMLRYASAVSGRWLPSAPARIASHRCITSRARQPLLLSQIATKWPGAGAWTVVETHTESQVSYSCDADATAFAALLPVGTKSMRNLTSARA